jgi:hypothetical protein
MEGPREAQLTAERDIGMRGLVGAFDAIFGILLHNESSWTKSAKDCIASDERLQGQS